MAVTLNGVTLNPNMVWADRYSYASVTQEVLTTLAGTMVVYPNTLTKGRPITLEARDDQGWLTKQQVDSMQALADTQGGIYTLVIGAETFTVMFRHQDAPALMMEPLIPRAVPVAGDYFVGTIKLMTV
jgi:hypothetical protein